MTANTSGVYYVDIQALFRNSSYKDTNLLDEVLLYFYYPHFIDAENEAQKGHPAAKCQVKNLNPDSLTLESMF